MIIIQIKPHSPQNTHTNIYIKKKRFILSIKPIAKLRPHHMTGVSQHSSQPSRESARVQINNVPLFGGGRWGGDGLILCVTLYTTKPCGFTTKMQFFERELFQNGHKQSLKKGDVNKGISVHM